MQLCISPLSDLNEKLEVNREHPITNIKINRWSINVDISRLHASATVVITHIGVRKRCCHIFVTSFIEWLTGNLFTLIIVSWCYGIWMHIGLLSLCQFSKLKLSNRSACSVMKFNHRIIGIFARCRLRFVERPSLTRPVLLGYSMRFFDWIASLR